MDVDLIDRGAEDRLTVVGEVARRPGMAPSGSGSDRARKGVRGELDAYGGGGPRGDERKAGPAMETGANASASQRRPQLTTCDPSPCVRESKDGNIQDVEFAQLTDHDGESDMRDIIALFDVEERRGARARTERMIAAVQALG